MQDGCSFGCQSSEEGGGWFGSFTIQHFSQGEGSRESAIILTVVLHL